MSEWYAITKDDVELSEDGTTVDVHIGHAEHGNIYVEIPIGILKELLEDK